MNAKATRPTAPDPEDAYRDAPFLPEELGWYMGSLAQWLRVGRDPAGRRERLLREAALQDRTALMAEDNAAYVARQRDETAQAFRQAREDARGDVARAAQALIDFDRAAGGRLGPHSSEEFGTGGLRSYVRQEYQLYRAALDAASNHQDEGTRANVAKHHHHPA